jgi:hypothetical protein
MTNYFKMPPIDREVKETKKTVFTHCLSVIDNERVIKKTNDGPELWENVMFLWRDKEYGDVFRCWDDGFKDDSLIFFGTSGDEFK